jgi:hypothetical protein
MSRHIGKPVPVETAPDGTPRCFTYHGVTYRVHAVLGQWTLADRWWQVTGERGRSNRYYWRVMTADHQVFELYLDVAWRPPLWVLDVIQD